MGFLGILLLAVGAGIILESQGVPVISMTVDAVGGFLEALLGEIAWGIADFFNPLNWF